MRGRVELGTNGVVTAPDELAAGIYDDGTERVLPLLEGLLGELERESHKGLVLRLRDPGYASSQRRKTTHAL
jgi:hypothetical protein